MRTYFLIPLGYLLVVALVALAVRTPMLFDDSYYAVVAKNLAGGLGYCASNYELYCFDSGITTGPTLIIPLSLAIRIFGAQIALPGVFNLALILALTSALALALAKRLPSLRILKTNPRLLFFSTLVLFLFIGNESRSAGEYLVGRHLVKFLGEFPALLFFWTGVALLYGEQPRSLGGGLLLGLAWLTKFILILPCAVFLSLYVLPKAWKKIQARSHGFLALGLIGPKFLFECYRLASIGPTSYGLQLANDFQFFLHMGSGFDVLRSADPGAAGTLPARVFHHVTVLAQHFGGWALFAGAIAATLYLVAMLRPQVEKSWLLSLFASGIACLAWWILFSPYDWIRHAFPGLLTLAFAALLAGFLTLHRLPCHSRYGLLALGIAYFTAQRSVFASLEQEIFFDHRLADFEDAIQFLEQHPGPLLFGCDYWSNPDFEYALPGTRHFRDCLSPAFHYAAPGQAKWLVRSDYFNWENDPGKTAFAQRCDQRLRFEAGPYKISECP